MQLRDGSGVVRPQVDKAVYCGPHYFTVKRFASYAHQLSEVVSTNPSSVLEIGVGNGVVSHLLRTAGIPVTTADIDESLHPDILASVTELPLPDNSYDLIACFEVLEHLPFGQFRPALGELSRIARRHVIISLPDCARSHYVEAKLPRLGLLRWQVEIPFFKPRVHKFDGEHYWEVSKAGFPLRLIVDTMRAVGFVVRKTYRVKENPYHRFFILEKPGS